MTKPKRVLIVSVKAGAGHLRAAEALEAAFREAHPRIEVLNIEALEHTNASFRKAYTESYGQLVKRAPSVWGMIYNSLERQNTRSLTKRMAGLVDRLNARSLLKQVKEFDPDAIVCTHFLPAELFGRRRRKGKLRAPVSIVLTDYDIHTMWIQRGADRYFVATDGMAYALRKKGIEDATVSVTGIPVMPAFAGGGGGDKAAARRKLGLREDVPAVTVAAGGFGMAGVDRVVRDLAETGNDVQWLAVAGRNEKLAGLLEKSAEAYPGKIVPFGFVTNMHELMAASEFMVTKCGGLTSSECLAMGLPMVIVNPIPGQEERNADFLLENGVALKANSPAHLIYKVQRLLNDTSLLGHMAGNARAVARPRAAFDIADAVIGGS